MWNSLKDTTKLTSKDLSGHGGPRSWMVEIWLDTIDSRRCNKGGELVEPGGQQDWQIMKGEHREVDRWD